MKDTIYRQAAIDALCRGEGCGNICRRALEHLLSAQPEYRWIPVTERLPVERTNPNTRDFEYVLCSTTFGDVRAYKFGATMGYGEPHFWNGVGCVDKRVLAWMPLPEPWKGEEDE